MACRVSEKNQTLDWNEREKELQEIVKWAKSRSTGYDCAIGVSGGKDSHFQALYAKEKLGMRPLLVNCAPDAISEVGAHNLENLIQYGFDMISLRPNPVIERYLSKVAFFKYGNFVKPLEYPLYTSAYYIALRFDIPLIIQGENDADVFGVDKIQFGPDAMNWTDVDTVNGCNASDWVDDKICMEDIQFYQFPDKELMRAKDMKAIFLAYYAKEWSNERNTQFAVSRGLRGRENHDPLKTGKTNRFASLDADLKVVNQMIKYLKFGFGAASDEVNFAIRENTMTREEGIMILERYDGECSDKYIYDWCEYIGITISEFWENVNKFVNRKLFKYDNSRGKWIPKFRVGEDFNET